MNRARHAGLSDPGLTHAGNEDRWLADPDFGLFLVSDGMADPVAPQMVVDLLPDLLRHGLSDSAAVPTDVEGRLQAALAQLNRQVRQESTRRTGLPGDLGATLVLVLLRAGRAVVAHLGDSRVYLCRDARLEQLTRDHSYVQKLLDEGRLTPAEAAICWGNGGPTRYIGMPGEPQADVRWLDLRPGDQLLLCSDGLTGDVKDAELEALLSRGLPPDAVCRLLIDTANAAGGHDNITALVIQVGGDGPGRVHE